MGLLTIHLWNFPIRHDYVKPLSNTLACGWYNKSLAIAFGKLSEKGLPGQTGIQTLIHTYIRSLIQTLEGLSGWTSTELIGIDGNPADRFAMNFRHSYLSNPIPPR